MVQTRRESIDMGERCRVDESIELLYQTRIVYIPIPGAARGCGVKDTARLIRFDNSVCQYASMLFAYTLISKRWDFRSIIYKIICVLLEINQGIYPFFYMIPYLFSYSWYSLSTYFSRAQRCLSRCS